MAREKKYVETILGRRRPIWDADSDNGLRRQAAERMAINMPIQGSSAEMIKIAMIRIAEEISKLNLRSKLVLQIHDELIFEFPSEEEEEVTTASSTLNNRKALCTSLRCSSEHESDLVRTTWRSYGSKS